jgi:hypothetical protein
MWGLEEVGVLFVEEMQVPYRLSREEAVRAAVLQYNLQDDPVIREAIYQALLETFATCFQSAPLHPPMQEFMNTLATHVQMYAEAKPIEHVYPKNIDEVLQTVALVWTPILNGIIRMSMEEYGARCRQNPYMVLKAATFDIWIELYTQTFSESVRVKPAICSLFFDACRRGKAMPEGDMQQQYLSIGSMQDYFLRSLVYSQLKERLPVN